MCIGGSPKVTQNITQAAPAPAATTTAPIALQDPLADQARISQDARVTALQLAGQAQRTAKPQRLLVNSGAGVTDSMPLQSFATPFR